MSSPLFYQISQTAIVVVLSFVGMFLCISQDWFKRQVIYTMMGVGFSLIVVSFIYSFASGGSNELFEIMLLKKFSMTGRLLLMGYSGFLTGLWLVIFNLLALKQE